MPRSKKVVEDILTTGVICSSYEEGINHLYEFTTRNRTRYNYAFLFEEEDGSLRLYERVGMPCWGATREYGCGTRPDDDWPSDLREARHKFPITGKPIAISFQFHIGYYDINDEHEKTWSEFTTKFSFNSEISPWRKCLKDSELTIHNDKIVGVVIKDTNFDPTIMISLMRNCGHVDRNIHAKWTKAMENNNNYHPALQYLKCRTSFDMYGFSPKVSVNRFVNGDPVDLSDGITFYERASYNRPNIDYIFSKDCDDAVLYNNKTIKQLQEILEHSEQEKLKVA